MGPRPRGSRCGSAGRLRSARRSCAATLSPERLEGVGVARQREHLSARGRPRCGRAAPGRARACGRDASRARDRAQPRGPSLASTSMSSELYVPSVSFGSLREEAEDRLAPAVDAGHDSAARGRVQTASSAKRPRSAKPSFRANASKIRRTIASFSAAATPLLPAGDEAVDVSPLGVGERERARRVGAPPPGRRSATAASRCSRCGVGWRSCLRSQRSRLTAAWSVTRCRLSSVGAASVGSGAGLGVVGLVRVRLGRADGVLFLGRLYALSRFERPAIQLTSLPSSPGSAGSDLQRFDLPGSAAGGGAGRACRLAVRSIVVRIVAREREGRRRAGSRGLRRSTSSARASRSAAPSVADGFGAAAGAGRRRSGLDSGGRLGSTT